VKIEIWSDVVCPWCYIGKRRFERALAEFEYAAEVDVTWRSFQLNPDMPAGQAVPTMDYLTSRFGPQSKAMVARVAELGRAEGLDLDFDASLSVNTMDAHRTVHLAADYGVAGAAEEQLLHAHFTQGADLSDPKTLTGLLAETGVPADRVRAVLAGTEYADAVRADAEQAYEFGATGVPFFVIDRTYGISGAQPADAFLHALRTARG
jgi:predicted DsbA family dithiol-disulfide isomerase